VPAIVARVARYEVDEVVWAAESPDSRMNKLLDAEVPDIAAIRSAMVATRTTRYCRATTRVAVVVRLPWE
jgi:hypothetical protein